jgi:hypothetical protein
MDELMQFEVPIDVPEGWTRQDALVGRNNPCLTVVVSPLMDATLQKQCKAILDTGAANVHVAMALINRLGLTKVNGGVDSGTLIAGQQDLTVYGGVTIQFPQIPDRVFPVTNIVEMPPNKGDVELIIGRNLLRRFILTYNGPEGRVFLALPDVATDAKARLRKITG